jgi:protein-disulfide isomerase
VPESRTSSKRLLLPLLVAALAAVALLAAVIGSPATGDRPTPTARSTQPGAPATDDPLAQLARRVADDPLAMGKVDAPVVMITYSDFQCPFCGKFARDTLPTLERKYVDNGTLRIEWRDFPYLGPESRTAALAGRAAAAQGRFWQFHDAMYADQLPPNSGRLDQQYLDTVARRIGLDVAQFRDYMKSDIAQRRIATDFDEGQSIGVTGTPSFVINGTPIVGAQPIEVFEQAIEAAAGS